jgi:hypothetical protein
MDSHDSPEETGMHLGGPHQIGDAGYGRTRWRHRDREYVVVTGPMGPGIDWTAIYDAPADSDEILLDRQRAGFDPSTCSVEQALELLPPA